MKCPIDETEMEEGLLDRGHWIEGEGTMWSRIWYGPYLRRAVRVIAWRCPKCQKIELVADYGWR